MSKLSRLCALSLILMLTSVHAAAQTKTPKGAPQQEAGRTESVPSESRSASQQSFEKDIAVLREKVDTLTTWVNVLAAVLVIVLGVGSMFSMYSVVATERRAREAHTIGILGEKAAQTRAEEVHKAFLEGSRNTLDLVNATLTLAKEASERAVKFIENKARAMLKELDQQAHSLVESVPSDDDRAIVADTNRRSELRGVAQKISAFEINRFLLPTDIELTPHCLFIRGLDFHLNQQFEEAFRCWRSVALTDNTPSSLKSLAWYWIGYEHNNLAQFEQAGLSFEKALEAATGARRFELRRIWIESRFFNKSKEAPSSLILPLTELVRAIESEVTSEELEARKIKVLCTLGNVCSQAGADLEREGKGELAKRRFSEAKTHFEAAAKDKWALFGLAEMKHKLGETDTLEIFKKMREVAIKEYLSRAEPRTKVLARTTELICCIRVPTWRSEVAGIYSQVIDALGEVDERLTIYSQVQKRNVSKSEFKEDLAKLMADLSETGPTAVETRAA